jgi:hypothetical protein
MRAAGVYDLTRGSVEKETRRHIRDLSEQLNRLRVRRRGAQCRADVLMRREVKRKLLMVRLCLRPLC